MGRKQDTFMKGMEAGARPFEEKFTKLSETTHQMGKEINSKLDGISGVIDILADDMSDMQKKELYNLNTPYDLKDDLDDDEKEIVVCSLLYLSKFTKNNEYQMKFLRSVINYTDMRTPSGDFDIACIENIESIKVQKIIMQTLMEYLYLGTEDFSFLDHLENVFGYFSVNRKGIQEIEANIETIYRATGKEGLAEKYGFVPVEETPAGNAETVSAKESYEFPCYDGSDISEACADKINIHYPYINLKNYLVYRDGYHNELDGMRENDIWAEEIEELSEICCIHKQTGEKKILDIGIKNKDSICGYDKYIYWHHDGYLYIIDIEKDSNGKRIISLSKPCGRLECNDKYLLCYTYEKRGKEGKIYWDLFCVNLSSMNEQKVKTENFSVKSMLVNHIIYFVGNEYNEDGNYMLYKYDFETGIQKEIAKLDTISGEDDFLGSTISMEKGHPFTYQYGKYIIFVKGSYYEEDIYYYCLDMENDRFDVIYMPNTKIYGVDFIYCAAIYNYIYYYSGSADIRRYDIITREKERILHSDNLVSYVRKGFKKIAVVDDQNGFSIVGDWIYYKGYSGLKSYKIDIKKKTEQKFEMPK